MLRLLLALLCFCVVGCANSSGGGGMDSEDDWTTGCPRHSCRCKWASGKRTAECQSSGLTNLPTFEQPDKIQVLHLEHNPLLALKDMAFQNAGLVNLQKVFLRNCSLSQLDPSAFEGLALLIELDLTHNRLARLIPGTFKGNFRIRKLWLSHNPPLKLTDYSFPHISHLRLLDLSHCGMDSLERNTFMSLELLEVLMLNDNFFRVLDTLGFVPIRRLKSLTLEGNPWQCDCHLRDFWRWLMDHRLYNSPTACAFPPKLAAVAWDKLEEPMLACPPTVAVPEPMVAVSNGDVVRLGCLVAENARMSWVRAGVVIANNSRSDDGSNYYTINTEEAAAAATVRSVVDGSEPKLHFRPDGSGSSRKKWFNLTIENVQPSGSGGYTCAAQNEGGVSEANVTVVYSESVATYLDKSEISALLVAAAAAGIMVFLCMGTFLVCLLVTRNNRLRRPPPRPRNRIKETGARLVSGEDEVMEMKDFAPLQQQQQQSFDSCSSGEKRKSPLSPGTATAAENCKSTLMSAAMERMTWRSDLGSRTHLLPANDEGMFPWVGGSGGGLHQLRQHGFSPMDHLRGCSSPPPSFDSTSSFSPSQQQQQQQWRSCWTPQPQTRRPPPPPPPLPQQQNGHSVSISVAEKRHFQQQQQRTRLLAKEVEARKELLEALVKDKNDTVV